MKVKELIELLNETDPENNVHNFCVSNAGFKEESDRRIEDLVKYYRRVSIGLMNCLVVTIHS